MIYYFCTQIVRGIERIILFTITNCCPSRWTNYTKMLKKKKQQQKKGNAKEWYCAKKQVSKWGNYICMETWKPCANYHGNWNEIILLFLTPNHGKYNYIIFLIVRLFQVSFPQTKNKAWIRLKQRSIAVSLPGTEQVRTIFPHRGKINNTSKLQVILNLTCETSWFLKVRKLPPGFVIFSFHSIESKLLNCPVILFMVEGINCFNLIPPYSTQMPFLLEMKCFHVL